MASSIVPRFTVSPVENAKGYYCFDELTGDFCEYVNESTARLEAAIKNADCLKYQISARNRAPMPVNTVSNNGPVSHV
jgi:hypothetical protein